jgi:hypothetical protein
MIGLLWGLGLLFSYLGQAWSGTDSTEGFIPMLSFFAVSTLVGLVLFPRTVGMALTPMFMASPVAFIISLFRHNFTYSLTILGIGLIAGLAQFTIARIRPDATY